MTEGIIQIVRHGDVFSFISCAFRIDSLLAFASILTYTQLQITIEWSNAIYNANINAMHDKASYPKLKGTF